MAKNTKSKSTGPAYKSPEYMKLLGQRRWKNVSQKKKKALLSKAAKRSHRINNPDANREAYHGGRRPLERPPHRNSPGALVKGTYCQKCGVEMTKRFKNKAGLYVCESCKD